MKIKKIAAVMAGILLFGVVACNAEETRTVEWYLAPENKEALDAQIKECKNNPGELWNTPNCVNARQAAERKMRGGKFEKVQEPPIPTF